MNKNQDTWMELKDLGKGKPYNKTYDFSGDFINDNHKFYSTCKVGMFDQDFLIDLGIPVWLQRADAEKLYEMTFFSKGDILELGTNRGLSAKVITQAIKDSDTNNVLETVEIDKAFYDEAKRHHKDNMYVNFNLGCANAFMDKMIEEKRKFGFIFIDHNHDYNFTKQAIDRLEDLLLVDGYVCLHDFLDPENFTNSGVKVFQAVVDNLVTNNNFEFWGNFGCIGMFKRIK